MRSRPCSRATGEQAPVRESLSCPCEESAPEERHPRRPRSVLASRCVGDLVAVLAAPQTTVSRHLAYLRRSGLVRVRKDGLWKHYSLVDAKTAFHRRLLGCLGGCFDEVRELAADRPRYERLKRRCCPS